MMLNMLDDMLHFAPTCRALGLDELIDDPSYADTQSRADNRQTLHASISEAIGSSNLADLRARLEAEDTIFAWLQSMLDVVDDPQVVANGYLAPHPDHPSCRVACAPMQFDDQMVEVRRPTDEILAELGYESDEIATLREVEAIA
jgi:crotonobetainyl-CoA:carnitine CoA-transferase CaiB-like acyl-CoA transferase